MDKVIMTEDMLTTLLDAEREAGQTEAELNEAYARIERAISYIKNFKYRSSTDEALLKILGDEFSEEEV